MSILPASIDFKSEFPKQSRRLRLGVVGGGRISKTQAMAARMTDRWEIVAGAFSSDPSKAQARADARRTAAYTLRSGHRTPRPAAKDPGHPPT